MWATPHGTLPSGSQRAILPGLVTRRWARLVRLLSGSATLVGVAVLIISAVVQRAIEGLELLAIPGIPIIVLGQIFSIAALTGETARIGANAMEDGTRLSWWKRSRLQKGAQKQLFAAAPRAVRITLSTVFVVCGLQALVGAALWGTPETTRDRCDAVLEEGGERRCVDPADKRRAEAAIQRFGGGVMTGFCAFHTLAAFGVLGARRDPEDGQPGRPMRSQ